MTASLCRPDWRAPYLPGAAVPAMMLLAQEPGSAQLAISTVVNVATLLVVAFGAGRLTAKLSAVDERLARVERRLFDRFPPKA